ncbi:MAG: sensor histidine kinase [Desulfovibrio sp.]|nr:sensor histidine kinase [Desulfovibrio sp.]
MDNDSQCMARLLASAVHDLRNVLAVIRESAGLAQDLTALAMRQEQAAPDPQRLAGVLGEAQQSVIRGAALADAMDYVAQAARAEDNAPGPCDMTRVCRFFCLLAARQARAVQMRLESGEAAEPVWANVPPLALFGLLLDVLDLCASVGGQVTLRFTAQRHHREEGIVVDVPDGSNRELVLAALAGNPRLESLRPGWKAALMPWREAEPRFFLSFSSVADA